MIRWLAVLLLAAPLTCAAQSIDQFFKDTFEQELRDNPEFATLTGHHEYDDRWTDWSKAGRELRREHLQQRLAMLSRFPEASLSGQNRLTADLVRYDFRLRLESDDVETHLLRVGQLFGFHNRVYTLIDRMPAHTAHDYENILARLEKTPEYVNQNLAILDESIARGMMQPKIVVDRVLTQLTTQMNQDAEHTLLLAAFRRFPSNMPVAEQQRLHARAVAAYQNEFLPSWRKLHDYLETTYAPKERPSDSLSSIPGGRAAYAILIRRMTTTTLSAEEIHSLGEKEVARIEAEMQKLVADTGFQGTLAEFQQKMKNDPQQHFHSKEEMLVFCRNIARIIEPELPNQFRHIPALLYGVRAIPADREASEATNAQAPSPDLSTPGWFNLNTYEPEKQVKYDKESLVLHEAVPGHVFQISLAHALGDLPDIRKFYMNSAYTEGWALYAESLGTQLGVYKDPYSRYGQLASERFRAVRLVVDTGIHELGWTRQQAIDYFAAHAPEESVLEIDRYISMPAQALSYKMGELRIRQLRSEAEQKLGPKFDVRDFHDMVLRNGTLPLDLLQREVETYLGS
ncbi:MAG TPA: DUF885 domain-containing protein [Bryobacteraceae bacterium]|nr:DUF885 domain-containing protein [Bryobacteraceae bacterium]